MNEQSHIHRERFMEIGNFVCRFGDDAVLLDYLDEIVVPAFFGDWERIYGRNRFLFHGVRWIEFGSDDDPRPAIAGRVVRDTTLVREQMLVEGRLRPAADVLESAPSAVFVLLLGGHRLLYYREHTGCPDMQQFGVIAERFLRNARTALVNDIYERNADSAERETKQSLYTRYPQPTVTITPVSSTESLRQFITRFGVLRSVEIALVPTNEEPDNDEFFRQWRKRKDLLDATKAKMRFSSSSAEGLDRNEAADQLEASLQGETEIQLNGKDAAGRALRGSNDEFKIKVPIEVEHRRIRMIAQALGNAFFSLVESGVVSAGNVSAQAKERLRQITRQIRNR